MKTTLRGRPGGYDVWVSRPNGSDIKIGYVQKEYGSSWAAVRNGKAIHKGSQTRKLAVAVIVNAWTAEPA